MSDLDLPLQISRTTTSSPSNLHLSAKKIKLMAHLNYQRDHSKEKTNYKTNMEASPLTKKQDETSSLA